MSWHMEDIQFPIRINRYLYLQGYCSRRQADGFIDRGFVTINGKPAEKGQKVSEKDIVEIESEVKNLKKSFEYYLYNKPVGIVSHNPQDDEQSVEDVFRTPEQIFPVGRLDKDSEGLMFMTNDRRIINKVLSPEFAHEKEYEVVVDKELKNNVISRMSAGVDIEGYKTKPAKVILIGKKKLNIVLTEGKKHQIRRMCAALGYQVKNLRRVRIMNMKLGSLPAGKGRKLSFPERKELLESLGMFH